jgi:hypothetical protein
MLYSVLCYESEALAAGRTKREDHAMMDRVTAVMAKLKDEGKLGPCARLMPTTTATHIRAGKDPIVVDGPFAETKEQLLGVYILECPSLGEAIQAATLLAREKPHGTLEIRPVAVFNPLGDPAKASGAPK